MVIFDLEWNSGGDDGILLSEILQIGAVRVDPKSWKILDTYSVNIHPSVHEDYSPPVWELPELEGYEASQIQFPAAVHSFVQWCGEEKKFGTWGGSDFPVLLQNLNYWKLSIPFPETYYNLQTAFALSLGAQTAIALQRAVEYCRIPDLLDPHNALNDSVYTAFVCSHIGSDILEQVKCPTKRPGDTPNGLPRRRHPWYGPFDTLDQALNDRACRRAECPVCGNIFLVGLWYGLGNGCYCSRISCPVHGTFLLKLETAQDWSSNLWGVTELEKDTKENRATLRDAKKWGDTYPCRAQPKPVEQEIGL